MKAAASGLHLAEVSVSDTASDVEDQLAQVSVSDTASDVEDQSAQYSASFSDEDAAGFGNRFAQVSDSRSIEAYKHLLAKNLHKLKPSHVSKAKHELGKYLAQIDASQSVE